MRLNSVENSNQILSTSRYGTSNMKSKNKNPYTAMQYGNFSATSHQHIQSLQTRIMLEKHQMNSRATFFFFEGTPKGYQIFIEESKSFYKNRR
jgi:hypothetical protein